MEWPDLDPSLVSSSHHCAQLTCISNRNSPFPAPPGSASWSRTDGRQKTWAHLESVLIAALDTWGGVDPDNSPSTHTHTHTHTHCMFFNPSVVINIITLYRFLRPSFHAVCVLNKFKCCNHTHTHTHYTHLLQGYLQPTAALVQVASPHDGKNHSMWVCWVQPHITNAEKFTFDLKDFIRTFVVKRVSWEYCPTICNMGLLSEIMFQVCLQQATQMWHTGKSTTLIIWQIIKSEHHTKDRLN